jgi:hypothetical protein
MMQPYSSQLTLLGVLVGGGGGNTCVALTFDNDIRMLMHGRAREEEIHSSGQLISRYPGRVCR